MSNLPETIGVLTFNPKTSKKLLNILKEYFKCMPYMLYPINDSLYILPNTKTLDVVLNNIYMIILMIILLWIFIEVLYINIILDHVPMIFLIIHGIKMYYHLI